MAPQPWAHSTEKPYMSVGLPPRPAARPTGVKERPGKLGQRLAAAAAAVVVAPAGFSGVSSFMGLAPRSVFGPRVPCDPPARQVEATPRTSAMGAGTDGLLIGGDGLAYDPRTTHLDDVPPIRPYDPSLRTGETLLYVNGAWTPPEQAVYEMELLANSTGHDVVGVMNATGGVTSPLDLPKDAVQAAGDKLGLGKNPAAKTVAEVLCQSIKARRELRVVGHSQGAATLGRALFDVDAHLAAEQGLAMSVTPSGRERRREALSVLEVKTTGGVGHAFPDGPHYTHLQNQRDPLTTLGVGLPLLEKTGLVRPGAGAERVVFADDGGLAKSIGYPAPIAPHVVDTYASRLAPEMSPARRQKSEAAVAEMRATWIGAPTPE